MTDLQQLWQERLPDEPHKTCRKCGVDKPLADYYRHAYPGKGMHDGHLNICKVCKSVYARAHLKVGKRKPYRLKPAHLKPQRRARAALNQAITRGKMKRGSCEECGVPNAHGHHEDYSKPYDVHWLCRGCHMKRHRKYP